MKIAVHSHLYNHATLLELEKLCNENNIPVDIHIRENEIQNCSLDYIIRIFILPDVQKIVFDLASSGLYDLLKLQFVKLLKGTKSSKHLGSMKIVCNNTQFVVENSELSDDIINKGLDVFKEIALSRQNCNVSPSEMMLNEVVVYPNQETGEIEVSKEFEFIHNHVKKK